MYNKSLFMLKFIYLTKLIYISIKMKNIIRQNSYNYIPIFRLKEDFKIGNILSLLF